jgi:1-acyl-sn-glycerol-3-phosphate acyltransferase
VKFASQALAAARALGFATLTASALAGVHARLRLSAPEARDAVIARHKRRYLQAVLRLLGAEVSVVAADPAAPVAAECIQRVAAADGPVAVARPLPSPGRGMLVVANHRSAIDIAVLLLLFDGHMLSRADLARWPLIGAGATLFGTVFVDRVSETSRAGAVRTMRKLLAAGRTVMVFPEGTTHAGDEVRPFHAGAFLAARGLDVDVVPVGLAYEPGAEYVQPTFVAHLGAVAARPRTRLAAAVGAPLRPADPRSTAEHARAAVQALVRRSRAALGG